MVGIFSNLGFSAKSASLESIWINFQNSGDFNPEHTHGGADLSFVIYLKVPDIIKKSYDNFFEISQKQRLSSRSNKLFLW